MKYLAAILLVCAMAMVFAIPVEEVAPVVEGEGDQVQTPPNATRIASKRGGNPSHCPRLPPGDGGAGFGCYNNKCWAYCGIGNQQSGQWCYTQKHSNQKWTGCRNDHECCPIYRCGGACSL